MNKTTIFRRIFLALFLVTAIQAVLLYVILYVNGVFTNLRDSEFSLLKERTQNKQQILEYNMVNNWENLSSTESSINKIVEDVLASQNKEWSDIADDAQLNALIIENCAEAVKNRMRINRTTGVFMILDGVAIDGQKDTYAGLFLLDTDPYNFSNDNSDLSIARGLPPLSRSMGISLDSFWDAAFTFEGGEENPENDYFFKPLNDAKKLGNVEDCSYCGYWAPTRKIINDNYQGTVTYSVPLINSQGFTYGVLGVSIKESYIVSQLNNGKYANGNDIIYLLGMTDGNSNTLVKVASTDTQYSFDDIDVTHTFINNGNEFIDTQQEKYDDDLYGSIIQIELYNNNTSFCNEKWYLVGIMKSDELLKESTKFRNLVLLVIMLTLIVGLTIAIVASHSIVLPIRKIMRVLKNNKKEKELLFPKTGIKEIDALSTAITGMNRDIVENAKRTSKLIELSGLPVGVYEHKKDSNLVYCSDGFFTILNCGCNDGSNIISIETLRHILESVKNDELSEDVYRIKTDGNSRYVKLISQSSEAGTIGAILDVTRETVEKQQIEHERDYDKLTGLYNRRAFESKVDTIFDETPEIIKHAAMVMLDLDNLKTINDTYGHDCGDMYIWNFAENLKVYGEDKAIVARRSGDEFYIFLYGFENKSEVEQYAIKCFRDAQNRTMKLPDGNNYKIRFSAGIAYYPEDESEPGKLVHLADFAMYKAKKTQKGTLQEFDLQEYRKESYLFNGHNALNRIIDDKLLKFMFQPIYSAHDGSVYGYELLMRSEVEELKTPNLILNMAKSQGKLHHIEFLTWLKGLSDAKNLINKGIIKKNEKLFVNSIANQIIDKEEAQIITEQYSDILSQVVMEVTESEDNNMEYTNKKLEFVRSKNGLIAIDDYGTGYNSELALVAIPSDIVKIDMSFVRDVDKDKDKQVLIKNLISYAKQRNIAVLAEGVETSSEMEVLISYGVDLLQGYYLQRPQYEPKELELEKIEEIKKYNGIA